MSLVKFIKQNKATVQAINNVSDRLPRMQSMGMPGLKPLPPPTKQMLAGEYREGSQQWWDVRVQVIDSFISLDVTLQVPSFTLMRILCV
jgi:hypothetical protein